jgi:hypothetical protein
LGQVCLVIAARGQKKYAAWQNYLLKNQLIKFLKALKTTDMLSAGGFLQNEPEYSSW